ncbi:MAG: hypothetical protein N2Z22_06915 [Turneriella sp.]|nr:hypothetical protein [Leptospiraceae bacterium]MCX7633044.1 hypothetical protein [Turneriella sp.]
MSVATLIFLVLSVLSFLYWLFVTLQLHQQKPMTLPWRGIVKLVALKGVPGGLEKLYPRWFRALWAFYALGCITVALYVWDTDHSFFVFIFPLLFYYFFIRYFLWEKADLSD